MNVCDLKFGSTSPAATGSTSRASRLDNGSRARANRGSEQSCTFVLTGLRGRHTVPVGMARTSRRGGEGQRLGPCMGGSLNRFAKGLAGGLRSTGTDLLKINLPTACRNDRFGRPVAGPAAITDSFPVADPGAGFAKRATRLPMPHEELEPRNRAGAGQRFRERGFVEAAARRRFRSGRGCRCGCKLAGHSEFDLEKTRARRSGRLARTRDPMKASDGRCGCEKSKERIGIS